MILVYFIFSTFIESPDTSISMTRIFKDFLNDIVYLLV